MRRLIRINMATVEPRPVEWLWYPYIPMGKETMLSGDPGLGKSYILSDLAARVTRGLPWPNSEDLAPKGSVLFISSEDTLDDTARPRLNKAGADCSKVEYIRTAAVDDEDGGGERRTNVTLAEDWGRIEAALKELGDVRLMVIDPISAYMGKVDTNNDSQVRGVLLPLAMLAEKYNVAILAISHLNKGGMSAKALYRPGGSIGFVGAARCALTLTQDKQSDKRCILTQAKNNIGPKGPGIGYTLEGGGRHDHPTVVWDDLPVDVDADEALSDDEHASSRLEEAMEWLRGQLREGGRISRELKKQALKDGIKWRTVERAKEQLDIDAVQHGSGRGSYHIWALPGEAAPSPSTQEPTGKTFTVQDFLKKETPNE